MFMNDKLRKLEKLKEEKSFIRRSLNVNYAFKKERRRLFNKMEKVDLMIAQLKEEINNDKNNDTITTNNQKK